MHPVNLHQCRRRGGQLQPGHDGGPGLHRDRRRDLRGWALRSTLTGCLLFGATDALRLALPALGYALNPQLLISAPYLLALIAMLVFAKSRQGPAALGTPFIRGIT